LAQKHTRRPMEKKIRPRSPNHAAAVILF
jgi:hypothetical protein